MTWSCYLLMAPPTALCREAFWSQQSRAAWGRSYHTARKEHALQFEEGTISHSSEAPIAVGWVAVKELNLGCHNMDIYIYRVNNLVLELWSSILSSLTASCASSQIHRHHCDMSVEWPFKPWKSHCRAGGCQCLRFQSEETCHPGRHAIPDP